MKCVIKGVQCVVFSGIELRLKKIKEAAVEIWQCNMADSMEEDQLTLQIQHAKFKVGLHRYGIFGADVEPDIKE